LLNNNCISFICKNVFPSIACNFVFEWSKLNNNHICSVYIMLYCYNIYLCMLDVRHSVYTNRISNRSILFQIQAMTLALEYPQLFCKFFAENLKKIIIYVIDSSSKALDLAKKNLFQSKNQNVYYINFKLVLLFDFQKNTVTSQFNLIFNIHFSNLKR